MNITKEIKNLISLSKLIGENPAFIQGGGGNTSYKNKGTLYVKASGYRLKDVCFEEGIVPMFIDKIIDYLQSPDNDENIFSSIMQSFVIEGMDRPSIETGFHSVIPYPYVLHTHSVYINVLACSLEGRKLAEEIFGDNLLWIDYHNPGIEILTAFVNSVKNRKMPDYIILQNHGFITGGFDSIETFNKHRDANNKVIKALDLELFSVKNFYSRFDLGKALFPDQLVYLSVESDITSSTYAEVASAYNYIANNIQKLGLTQIFIPERKILQILGMESEKYRKSIL